jgi:hypothetical protein
MRRFLIAAAAILVPAACAGPGIPTPRGETSATFDQGVMSPPPGSIGATLLVLDEDAGEWVAGETLLAFFRAEFLSRATVLRFCVTGPVGEAPDLRPPAEFTEAGFAPGNPQIGCRASFETVSQGQQSAPAITIAPGSRARLFLLP